MFGRTAFEAIVLALRTRAVGFVVAALEAPLAPDPVQLFQHKSAKLNTKKT